MAERVHRGRPASPGIAIGALVRLERVRGPAAAATDPAGERARLETALEEARGALDDLMAAEDELAAAILAFQRELLDDPALHEPALLAIAAGVPAEDAWRSALAPQIRDYEEGEDEYFRARAADLRDLMDRVLTGLAGAATEAASLPEGAILLDRDLTPSRFLALDWPRLGGAALEAGSPAAHVAMLARARGVPMVTGLGALEDGAGEGILDGEAGLLVASPTAATRAAYAGRRRALTQEPELETGPALTARGERVELMVNVDDPLAVDDAVLRAGDGVGLLRTEFLVIGRDEPPDEAAQLGAYLALLNRLDGRTLTVRTFDIGGDKPLPGLDLPAEANPFLGLRGLRLSLERPDLFLPQVRALLRAAPGRPLKVMLPMVTLAAELEEARALFRHCLAGLVAEGVPAAMPPLGIMVETPAAAIAPELIPADFYSIGSNDLTQYVMAAARDAGGRVAALNDPLHPAVLRLIEGVVAHGRAHGLPVSLCGDMASDPEAVPVLLGLGLRQLSVAPAALGRVRRAVGAWAG